MDNFWNHTIKAERLFGTTQACAREHYTGLSKFFPMVQVQGGNFVCSLMQ